MVDLEIQNITKRYGQVTALDGVSLTLRGGEVHALLGENGAGKSTLSRVIAGASRADSGRILIDGRPVRFASPLDAQRHGVAILYQELDLFPQLRVGENIVIGNLRYGEGRLVNERRIETFCRPFLEQVGLAVPVTRLVGALPIGQQQLVAIARALSMNCRVLLLDEPTSALSDDAAERLFSAMAALKAGGVAIVYVSHKMDEISRLCDRVTVLRDGRCIGTFDVASVTRADLVHKMVGRAVDTSTSATRSKPGQVVLKVNGLNTRKLKNVSFELRRGEVLGIAGLVGAGRSELGNALLGLDRVLAGDMHLDGEPYDPRGPCDALRRGVALMPEDRKLQGLMLHMSVRENATISILPQLGSLGLVATARQKAAAEPVFARLALKCESDDMAVEHLSGGNQQKVLLARWLLTRPAVLFLDDPARGIDIGAKEDIYRLIDELAGSGMAILLASSELAELLRCADRILVLNDGRVAACRPAAGVTQEMIIGAATHSIIAA